MPGIFFGTTDDEKEYLKKQGIEMSVTEDDKSNSNNVSKVNTRFKIDVDELEPLTDEELRILTRARHRNDPHTVYMQSDMSFYDKFYMDGEDENEIVTEVHRMRRIYKDFRSYYQANMLREAYMKWLLDEKFNGDENMFMIMVNSSNPEYYIPPIPIYSVKSSNERPFDVLSMFRLESLWEEPSEEDIQAVFDYMAKDVEDVDLGKNPGDGIYSDVETNLSVIECCEDLVAVEEERSNGRVVKNAAQEVRDIINSWYHDDNDGSNDLADRLFSKTPNVIREKYFKHAFGLTTSDEVHRLALDPFYDGESHVNWNELVYDDVSGRPMSRLEMSKRHLIRDLGKCGWNELDLMGMLNVGTQYERRQLARKEQKRMKIRNKVTPETAAKRAAYIEGNYDTYSEMGDGEENVLNELKNILGVGGSY